MILHPTQEFEPPANPVRFTPLFIYASSLFRQTMQERGLRPTQDHIDGLLAVLKVLCQMEEGSYPSSIHLSSLDPGIGKTMAVVCFLKALRQYPGQEDVGIFIFVSRLDEVRKLIDEAGLAKDDFAVLAADEGCNQLSSTPSRLGPSLFHHPVVAFKAWCREVVQFPSRCLLHRESQSCLSMG